MKKAVKAIYIVLVAIVVFTGALLIIEGAKEHAPIDVAVTEVIRTIPIDNEEGSAI